MSDSVVSRERLLIVFFRDLPADAVKGIFPDMDVTIYRSEMGVDIPKGIQM